MELLQENMKVQTYQNLAMTDSLTHIGNHAAYLEKLELLKQSSPSSGNILLVMMDVNFLKETNDQHGHNAGDVLLKGAARCIRQTFSDFGNCYRIGGDEFIVILEDPDCSPETYSRKLDLALEEHNVNSPFPVSLARVTRMLTRVRGISHRVFRMPSTEPIWTCTRINGNSAKPDAGNIAPLYAKQTPVRNIFRNRCFCIFIYRVE